MELSFYSTYEGLKLCLTAILLVLNIMFLLYLWGIKTLCEIAVVAEITGFYSTYEGLKRFTIIRKNKFRIVLTLPIRD